ncbi:hypothetical protein QOT17_014972 [Balamuthia mandrillaris]
MLHAAVARAFVENQHKPMFMEEILRHVHRTQSSGCSESQLQQVLDELVESRRLRKRVFDRCTLYWTRKLFESEELPTSDSFSLLDEGYADMIAEISCLRHKLELLDSTTNTDEPESVLPPLSSVATPHHTSFAIKAREAEILRIEEDTTKWMNVVELATEQILACPVGTQAQTAEELFAALGMERTELLRLGLVHD